MAPRSAVKLYPARNSQSSSSSSSSPAARKAQSLQARAVPLERELQHYVQSKQPQIDVVNDPPLNRFRERLCEVLADLWLTYPRAALEYDVDTRLWRHCFYARIVPQRSRLYKLRHKCKTTSSSSSSSSSIKHKSELATLEQAFATHLAESITLYQYLHKVLQARLEGRDPDNSQSQSSSQSETQSQDDFSPQSQSQLSQSQQSQTDDDCPSDKSTEGLVECLYLLNIRLGDLYRYQNELEQAQRAYQRAAHLGPGHGHAYNQLAVVCQVKTTSNSSPLSAVALYWYVRSLYATHAPFETSVSNLERLLRENRDWIVQQEQQSPGPVSIPGMTSKPSPLHTRQFLAEWVDFHRLFLEAGNKDSTTVLRTMDQILSRFGTLLQSSAFGDALLMKLIAIQAASEACVRREMKPASSAAAAPHKVFFVWAARCSTYQMGGRLADKVLQSAMNFKTQQQQQQQQQQQHASAVTASKTQQVSVRLWLPLLLLTEYVFAQGLDEDQEIENGKPSGASRSTRKSKAQQRFEEARQEFWERMVQVWNHAALQFGAAISELPPLSNEEGDLLKDFRMFVGFVPFQSFCPLSEESRGFLSNDPAIECLNSYETVALSTGMTQLSQTPQDRGQSHALLAQRILHLANRVERANPHITSNTDRQEDISKWLWEWHHSPQEKHTRARPSAIDNMEEDNLSRSKDSESCTEDEDEPMLPPDNDDENDDENDPSPSLFAPSRPRDDSSALARTPKTPAITVAATAEKDKENTLVYQSGLLVPAAFLGTDNNREKETPASTRVPANNNDAEDVDMDHIMGNVGSPPPPSVVPSEPAKSRATLAPPPGIQPPPGFGGAASNELPPPPGIQAGGFLSGANPSSVPYDSGSFLEETLFGSATASAPATIGSIMSHASVFPPTDNPFVVPGPSTLSSNPYHDPPEPRSDPLAFLNTAAPLPLGSNPGISSNPHPGGATLLESGLLQSLWTDDSTTNPFANPS